MTEQAEFQAAVWSIETAYRDGLKAFAAWFEREWQHQKGKMEWERVNREPYPGDVYIDGYNAGVQSVHIALGCFLDEMGR